jgi:hypothetical protein
VSTTAALCARRVGAGSGNLLRWELG